MQISKRLREVATMVESGGCVADIGCDHGFTSIYLIQNQLADSVIAMDINQGPLDRAKEHIAEYGCEKNITTRLSDGAKELAPGEANTLLISGMGGALICKILDDSPKVLGECRELVLSPQSEIHLVREYLHNHGFAIASEKMLVDQGKFYVIIRGIPGRESYKSTLEYEYGKYLIEEKNPVLLSFLKKEGDRTRKIISHLESAQLTPSSKQQLMQRRQELAGICEVIEQMKP